jgi:hypothetical protein
MRCNVMVVLCVACLFAVAVRGQEAPAAQPAAEATPPAAPVAAAAAGQVQGRTTDVPKRIAAAEREARRMDPTIALKLKDLETQRRQIFIQAKPELEALYAEQDALGEKARPAQGKPKAEEAKARQRAGAKAERKADRQATKTPKVKAEP